MCDLRESILPSLVNALPFISDTITNTFNDRLLEILDKYQDPRLVYTPIPKKYKIPVSTL